MTKDYSIRKVESSQDFELMGELRYRCYRFDGVIDELPSKIFLDEYDSDLFAESYIVDHQGGMVGTMRLHMLDKDNCKSATMTSFSDLLEPKLLAGLRIIDAARFAIDPEMGARRLSVALQLLKLYRSVAHERAVDYGVAAVPLDRVPFYSKLYGFRELSDARPYSGLNRKLVLVGVESQKSGLDGE